MYYEKPIPRTRAEEIQSAARRVFERRAKQERKAYLRSKASGVLQSAAFVLVLLTAACADGIMECLPFGQACLALAVPVLVAGALVHKSWQ